MITIVLHTHLPYVLHHGAWPHGSDWLCEAVAECYLPILKSCRRLMDEGIRPGLTFDISPILCEQLAHPDFPKVFKSYCEEHALLASKDAVHFESESQTEFVALAKYWEEWFSERLREFEEEFSSDVVGAFRALQDEGAVEMLTCAATHGYLPLLAEDASIDLQLQVAVDAHQRHFGKHSRGIWLPECAYRPEYPWRTLLPVSAYAVAKRRDGIEQFLYRKNLDYFFSDQGALNGSVPIGYRDAFGKRTPFSETYGASRRRLESKSVFNLYRASGPAHEESAAFFTRHTDLALQVWSGQTGYPGDPDYLDFHKRFFKSSHRYWRVTDNKADMQYKQVYVPEWAEKRAQSHAKHYAAIIKESLMHQQNNVPESHQALCLPFDTELFGHWWFEGPIFLEQLIREFHELGDIQANSSQIFDSALPSEEVVLPESSWGRNGNHDVWMNPDVEWTWEKEYKLEYGIRMFFEKHDGAHWDSTLKRIIVNMMRQVLLAQSSDWQFLISTFSSREYAEQRFHSHLSDANQLRNTAERYATSQELRPADEKHLSACELRDGIFEAELTKYLS